LLVIAKLPLNAGWFERLEPTNKTMNCRQLQDGTWKQKPQQNHACKFLKQITLLSIYKHPQKSNM